jgi:predicted TPR repeat methyltransferase
VWDEETAARYDADAASQFVPAVLGPTVDLLERLADGGPALEFAIGTGRVGIPLAERGVPVTGIELSTPMVAQLRRKVGETRRVDASSSSCGCPRSTGSRQGTKQCR